MSTTSVAVHIPQSIYDRLERAASRMQMPVSDLLAETLQVALPPGDELPAHIQAEIAGLEDLDENRLVAVANSEMASGDQQALEQLLDAQGMRPLTTDEQDHLEKLRSEYGRVLLRKARASALLAERGHPPSCP
jgi:hypothetical protein